MKKTVNRVMIDYIIGMLRDTPEIINLEKDYFIVELNSKVITDTKGNTCIILKNELDLLLFNHM